MANLTVELANIVTNTGVKASYGEPIELGDTTVIPVSFSQFGFGGGQGPDEEGEESSNAGAGGGGGISIPVGAYVKQGDSFMFQPNPVTLLVAAVPFVFFAGRALSRIIRALKK